MARSRHPGFTLIELLVVILIISILVTLSTMAYRAIRDQAESTRCHSSLRQYGAAALLYCGENRGYLPLGYVLDGLSNGYNSTNLQNNGYWKVWCDYVGVGDNGAGVKTIAKILACPAANRLMQVAGLASARTNRVTYWPIGTPGTTSNTKLTDIQYPDRCALMLDAGQFNCQNGNTPATRIFYYDIDGTNYPPLMPHRGGGKWTRTNTVAPTANLGRDLGYFQGGQEVVLFFDGRAALMPLDASSNSETAIPWPMPNIGPKRRNWNLFWKDSNSLN